MGFMANYKDMAEQAQQAMGSSAGWTTPSS
jgi:hypothetical protein